MSIEIDTEVCVDIDTSLPVDGGGTLLVEFASTATAVVEPGGLLAYFAFAFVVRTDSRKRLRDGAESS